MLVKPAATGLGGNVRRTKYLENTSRHKMRDTERNRCEIDYSKSKCKALGKRISAVSGGFTSWE